MHWYKVCKILSFLNNVMTSLFIHSLIFFSAKDIQRCKFGDSDCIVAESNRVLHSSAKGHAGLNLIQIDPLHISDITLKQGSESPVNIELNFKETDLIGLQAHDFYSIK